MDWFLYDNGLRHERVKLSSGVNQKKKKRDVGGEIFLKSIEQGVCHNLL